MKCYSTLELRKFCCGIEKQHSRFDKGSAMKCAGNSMCDIGRIKHLSFGRCVEREMRKEQEKMRKDYSLLLHKGRRRGRPSGSKKGYNNSQPAFTLI